MNTQPPKPLAAPRPAPPRRVSRFSLLVIAVNIALWFALYMIQRPDLLPVLALGVGAAIIGAALLWRFYWQILAILATLLTIAGLLMAAGVKLPDNAQLPSLIVAPTLTDEERFYQHLSELEATNTALEKRVGCMLGGC